METLTTATNLTEARSAFLSKLPDPSTSENSTIIERFQVKGKEVMLLAQKQKGHHGMCWYIENRTAFSASPAEISEP
jgi:hypothetical protein